MLASGSMGSQLISVLRIEKLGLRGGEEEEEETENSSFMALLSGQLLQVLPLPHIFL
jgi:hypothetical protein